MNARAGYRFDLRPLLVRRRTVLLLYTLIAVAMVPGLARLESDNSPEGFFVRDHQALSTFRALEYDFGSNRMIRFVVKGPGVWTAPGLSWLHDIEVEAGKVRGVRGAMGLWGHHEWQLAAWPPPDPRRFREAVLKNRLDRDLGWVSRDGSVVTVLVVVDKLSPPARRVLLGKLDKLLSAPPPGVKASMMGLAIVSRAWDREGERFAVRFLPLLAFLALVLLVVLLRRRPWDALLPLAMVLFPELVMFGTMGYAGQRVDMVVIVLAPLLFVISLATATHLLLRFRDLREQGGTLEDAVVATYREKGWPVFWSGVTTFVGFGSMAVARTPSVEALGVWSAYGIAVMTLACFTLYPALLMELGSGSGRAGIGRFESWASRIGSGGALWSIHHRRGVLTLAAALALMAAFGAARLKLTTNLVSYLPEENPVRTGIQDLQSHGIGALSAALVLREEEGTSSKVEDLFTSRTMLERLRRLSSVLRRQPFVVNAVGAGDLLADVDAALLPLVGPLLSDQQEALALARLWPESRQLRSAFLRADGRSARVSIFLPMRSDRELEAVFSRAEAAAKHLFPRSEVQVTGQFPLVLAASRTLRETLLLSFAITLMAVAFVFRLLVGSLRVTLLALAPNILPVLLVLGLIGLVGVPLDGPTVMIAAVVLGLAVDDSIHTLGGFRDRLRDATSREAVVSTLAVTAPAQILSSGILALGFAVCAFASFLPIARFGLFAAIAVVIALLADLLLMPVLLARLGEKDVARLVARTVTKKAQRT